VTDSALHIRSFAKINLALSVLGKRTDGYHNIQTVFQMIDLCDELELWPSTHIELRCDSLPDLRAEDNLVWKAANLIASKGAKRRGACIILKKRIPAGAGLGGGSSNAAAALIALNRFWQLDIPEPDLWSLAKDLGSDVPFFLNGGTAVGSGRGEILHPLLDFPSYHLVVIFPGVHVSTAEAYRSLNLGLTSSSEDFRIQGFIGKVQAGTTLLTELFNDFEASILPAYPPIMEAKTFLQERGAIGAMLSGSGSSVFGFFSDEESAFAVSRSVTRETWRVFPAKTLSRAEYFQKMFG
jgi:4-diphosphocytidyl-2-C-methyl-D-erythritol kinase